MKLQTRKFSKIIMAGLIALCALSVFGQAQTEPRDLLPNQTIEREMTVAETHQYKFDLKANEFFQVRVEQKGVDVLLRLIDANGAELARMDSPNGKEGPETISFIAAKAGGFVLEVSGFDEKAEKGLYTIKRETSRTATPNDKRRVAVEKLFVEGMTARDTAGQGETAIKKLEEALAGWRELKDEYLVQLTAQQVNQLKQTKANTIFDEAFGLFNQGTAESYNAALEKFREASRLYQEIDDKSEKAGISLVASGVISDRLGEKETALKFYEKALLLFRAGENKNWEAATLNNIGAVYDALGEKQKALEFYNLALPLRKVGGDKRGEATTLTSIGLVYSDLGEKQKALEFYNLALPLQKAVGDKSGEAATLTNIGAVYDALGEKQKALEFYNLALPLWKAVGDKRGEATTLSNIGKVYSDLGEKQKALEFYNLALPLWKAVGDKRGEATTLSNIGKVYSDLGEQQKALEFYNLALPLWKAVGDKSGEATTLNNIGGVYSDLGEQQKALEFYNLALPLKKVVGDKNGEANTLNNIGGVYDDLGEQQKALEFYNLALSLMKAVGDKRGEANTLSNIGEVYSDLGEKQKALEFYNLALPLQKAVGDKSGEAATLTNIGAVYDALGEKQKALEFYNLALPLWKAVGNKSGEATTLSNIGAVYSDLGEKQKALEFYNLALPLRKVVGDKSGEAVTLTNIGKVYSDLGEQQKALEFFNLALPLSKAVGDKSGEAVTLNNAMYVWESLKNGRLAVFYGKQSVNKYQELRQAIQTLDKETQKTYLKTVEHTYRALADILVAEGRLFEAQQILAMLKEDEYFGYVRRDPDEIKKLASRADLRSDERAALEKYEALAGKLTEYGTQFVKLEELKNKQGADFNRQAEYEDLKQKLDTANAAFRIFLEKELVAELGKPVDKEIKEDKALQAKLEQWGNGTVALYTIAGEDRYRVILTTPKTQIDGKTEIKIADLNRKIFAFRAALQNPAVDPRPMGKELYDILIKPIEKDLLAAEAKTLVWSLDGTLRYIPFAALSPDGVHYLAEKYQTVVVTSTTRQSLVAEVNPNWRLLGAGVTKESKLIEPNGTQEIFFSKLPGVESELLNIVSNEDAAKKETGLMTGKRLIDDGFNLTSLENGMSQRVADKKPKYNVIHLATHFRLGNDTAKSFLLMGNNQALTLEKVSDDTALNFGDVELVTLSACNTGFGTTVENKAATKEQERKLLEENNGAEVDSLATFIELRGAKAVLASLWAVADESTQLLMSEFYRLRKENPKLTKAEAMQIAQQAMISGKLKSSGNSSGCRNSEVVNLDGSSQTKFKCDANAPFSHPFYWSPFVLIGNWR